MRPLGWLSLFSSRLRRKTEVAGPSPVVPANPPQSVAALGPETGDSRAAPGVYQAGASNPGLTCFDSFMIIEIYSRERQAMASKVKHEELIRYADMFAAMGSEPRLRIMRLLLSAHPEGMVVGDIGTELEVTASTLSHHLEKLKNEDLVRVQREGTFLRYSANTVALEQLLGFLYAECCTRNKAVESQRIVCCK
jgi:ArsR family transcriptional regulator